MIHSFHISKLSENPYYSSALYHRKIPEVSLHDDLIRYIGDSFQWVSTFNPVMRMKPQEGLNFYGPTVLKSTGANSLRKIANAWSSLFKQSPQKLQLTGEFSWIDGQGYEDGRYERITFDRDEIVANLDRLESICLTVAESGDHAFIMHMGI